MAEVSEALPPYLTAAEIADICEGLTQNAAKLRYLRRLGLHVTVKPSGAPHVARTEYERVLGAARLENHNRPKRQAPGDEPDTAAAMAMLNNRRRHGAQATR